MERRSVSVNALTTLHQKKVALQTIRVAITNIGGEISAYYCAVVGLLCVVVPEITVLKTSHVLASGAGNVRS